MELEESIGHLKIQNVQLKSELKDVTENVMAEQERKLYNENVQKNVLMDKINMCRIDLTEKDEQIQIRNQQVCPLLLYNAKGQIIWKNCLNFCIYA